MNTRTSKETASPCMSCRQIGIRSQIHRLYSSVLPEGSNVPIQRSLINYCPVCDGDLTSVAA